MPPDKDTTTPEITPDHVHFGTSKSQIIDLCSSGITGKGMSNRKIFSTG
jgi:hypothetical protein